MQFSFKSQTKTGELKEGLMEASDKFSAAKQIRAKGEIPISINEQKKHSFLMSLLTLSISKIKLREKIIFTRNLSGMLQAGLPMTKAIGVLMKQTTNKKFKDILSVLLDTINKGGTLSLGMSKYPHVFSSLFVSMIKAGEESGKISDTLDEIGRSLQKSFDLNKKIKSALTYPTIIICVIIIIGVLMMIYVVPSLTKTFTSVGAKLPASTQAIIWISTMLQEHLLLFVGAVAGFVFSIVLISKLKTTKKYFDLFVLHLPVVGNLVKEVNTARTARTLSSLLSAGVPVARALSISKDILQNFYYKKIIDDGIKAIEKGQPLSATFKMNTKFYPVMVGEMMEVGEETGKFSVMLMDIASFYESEVDSKTKDLSTIVEPVLMVFIGAAVGFFAVSMITPMYSLLGNIK